MSDWIPYEGSGEKPAWIPDDCRAVRQYANGFVGEPSLAGDMNWKRGGIVAFKIVDPRYQHLVPPTREISFDNLVMPSGEAVKVKAPAHIWTEKAEEPAPVWPLVKYNVYRNAEFLGTVEIEDRPGMTNEDRQGYAADQLLIVHGMAIRFGEWAEFSLRRVSLSTNRRRGKLVRMEGRG